MNTGQVPVTGPITPTVNPKGIGSSTGPLPYTPVDKLAYNQLPSLISSMAGKANVNPLTASNVPNTSANANMASASPSSNEPFWKKAVGFGASLLPAVGGTVGGLLGIETGPGAILTTGVGAALGSGLQELIDQKLGITKTQSFGQNVKGALETGAEYAPFGLLNMFGAPEAAAGLKAAGSDILANGFKAAMPTISDGIKAALPTIGKLAATGGVANLISTGLSDAFNGEFGANMPKNAVTYFARQGLFSALQGATLVGGLSLLSTVAKTAIDVGNPMTTDELIKRSQDIMTQARSEGANLVQSTPEFIASNTHFTQSPTAGVISGVGGNIEGATANIDNNLAKMGNLSQASGFEGAQGNIEEQMLKNNGAPTLENAVNAASLENPESMKTGVAPIDSKIESLIREGKSKMVNPENVDTFDKYNVFHPSLYGEGGEGVDQTLNRLKTSVTDANGNVVEPSAKSIVGNKLSNMASGTTISYDALDTAFKQINNNTDVGGTIRSILNEFSPEISTADREALLKMITIGGTNSEGGVMPTIQTDDTHVTKITNPSEVSLDGEDVLNLKRSLGDVGYGGEEPNPDTPRGRTKILARRLYKDLSTVIGKAINDQKGEVAYKEYSDLNGEYSKLLDGEAKLTKMKASGAGIEHAKTYSAANIIQTAKDTHISNAEKVAGVNLANALKDAGSNMGKVRQVLINKVFAPLGFVSDVVHSIKSMASLGIIGKSGADVTDFLDRAFAKEGINPSSQEAQSVISAAKDAGLSEEDLRKAQANDKTIRGARGKIVNTVAKMGGNNNNIIKGLASAALVGSGQNQ